MRRRDFITVVAGAAAAWPLAARAQQSGKLIRIGFFGASLAFPGMAEEYATFLAELREQGFEEGQNIALDYKRNDDPRGLFASAAETTVVPEGRNNAPGELFLDNGAGRQRL
jgi:hypothetical protein